MKNVEKLEIKKLCIKLKPYIKMDKKSYRVWWY